MSDPIFQAQEDFKHEGEQANNPYPKDSKDYRKYAWEMHRLWMEENKAFYLAGRLGV